MSAIPWAEEKPSGPEGEHRGRQKCKRIAAIAHKTPSAVRSLASKQWEERVISNFIVIDTNSYRKIPVLGRISLTRSSSVSLPASRCGGRDNSVVRDGNSAEHARERRGGTRCYTKKVYVQHAKDIRRLTRQRYVARWIRRCLNLNRGSVKPRRLAWVDRKYVGQVVVGSRVERGKSGNAEAATPIDDGTPHPISGPSVARSFRQMSTSLHNRVPQYSIRGNYASPKNEAVAE
jgi:hypothetical protein